MYMNYLPKDEERFSGGQALLLVLLSMAVVLTIVLSILSRSVTDVAISSREEEALRAFSAAEAGIEQAIVIGTSLGETEIGNATFATNVSSFAEGATEFASPIGLLAGEVNTVWFMAHDENGELVCSAERPCFADGSIKVCWGKEETAAATSTTPALEISVFYADPAGSTNYKIARAAVDPNSDRRSGTNPNSFSAPGVGTCTISGENYAFNATLDLAALDIPPASYSSEGGLQFARLRMFYNTDMTHPVGVSVALPGNGSLLPAQGLAIESSGKSGEANRKISVFQGFGEIPEIFNGAIFSLGGITK
jgi:Tfp pilus assembly protein PilX